MQRTRSLEQLKIIDTHCHIFPDPVAQRASDNVGNYYHLPMQANGRLEALLKGNKGLDVVGFVISSAALNPLKTHSVNHFIETVSAAHPQLIGLGSVHPDTPNLLAETENIIQAGLYGVKLHPDFQQFDIDDERMFPVYDALSGRLPILFHVGDQTSDHSSPKRLRRVLDLFPNLVVIAAHMGGYTTLDLAEEYLVGTNCYFDTSNAQRYMSDEYLASMIRRHGVEKIFFGSDFPLLYTADAAREFFRIPLTDDEFEQIFYHNAARFFHWSER